MVVRGWAHGVVTPPRVDVDRSLCHWVVRSSERPPQAQVHLSVCHAMIAFRSQAFPLTRQE
eukprot:6565848-Alexandrium_andersonii.AAC.1